MFNHASGQLLPATQPPLRTELFVDSCSVRHQGNCCASTREIPATWISICRQGTKRCSCDKTAALARHKHTWISLRAQRDMLHRKDCCALTPRAHLDLSPCARKKTCSFDRLLRSHATSTLGSLSVRRETCSGEKTAALTLRAHLYLVPCAERHVPSKRLLRSRAAPQDR